MRTISQKKKKRKRKRKRKEKEKKREEKKKKRKEKKRKRRNIHQPAETLKRTVVYVKTLEAIGITSCPSI